MARCTLVLPREDEGVHTPITPSLFLGSPPPWDDVVEVSTAAEAFEVINAGGTAVLPADAWQQAEEVLARLSSADYAAKRVTVARARYG